MRFFRELLIIGKFGLWALLFWYAVMTGMTAHIMRAHLREGTVSAGYILAFPATTMLTLAGYIKKRFIISRMLPFPPNWVASDDATNGQSPTISDSMSARWPGSPEWPIDTWTRLPIGMPIPSPSTLAGKVVVIYCFQHW